MKRIGIISDTHGYWDERYEQYLGECDEIWHAGDIGSMEVADRFEAMKPIFRAVHGNIDGGALRVVYPQWQQFDCEQVPVLITHIGGYPGHYQSGVETRLRALRPKIFISGHSHILKVIYDKKLDLLHLNPGAAGLSGFHQVRTALRFTVDGERIEELEVGEWKRNMGLY